MYISCNHNIPYIVLSTQREVLLEQVYEFTLQIENVLSQTATATVYVFVTDDVRPMIELETQCPQQQWLQTGTLSIQPLLSFD